MSTTRADLLAVLLPVTRALRKIEDAAAAAHGVTMWQYAVLAVVCARPGIGQGEAAELMDYSRNRIIADLDALEQLGFVRRVAGTDRRVNALHITAAGMTVKQAVQADIHRGEDDLLVDLSPTARSDFARIGRQLSTQVSARRLSFTKR